MRQLHKRFSGIGKWLSLVEHLVRDQGVAGSNPVFPTVEGSGFVGEIPKARPFCFAF